MKICPACKTQYSDDTLQFCLQDGTPLTWREEPETPTVVLAETETVAAQRGQRMNIPVGDPNSPAWQASQMTHVATAMPEKKGSKTMIAVALILVGMFVLFVIVGLAAIIFWRNSQLTVTSNVNRSLNTNVSISNTSRNSSPTPNATSTPWRTPTPASTPQTTPVPPAPPLTLSSYPSTARLKFARGAYSTSFSGEINPGDSRSLVLGCRAGQSLSANVSSSGGCVQLSSGGSSLRTFTNGGDNYIRVTNNCSSVVHFSVSITII